MAVLNREEWERIRAGGRTRYMLLWGVCGRGIPIALVLMVIFLALEGRSFDAELLRDTSLWIRFVLAAALFSVGGVVSSYNRWRQMEQRYGGDGPGAVG